MKRLIVFIIGIVTACCVMAADTDSTFVMKALKEARSLPSATNFPLHFARLFIGRPYVAHTLEVADPERLVVNTRQLDCTTLVENVTALTLCVLPYIIPDMLKILGAYKLAQVVKKRVDL